MPLASWYDCPCAVAMAASTEATSDADRLDGFDDGGHENRAR